MPKIQEKGGDKVTNYIIIKDANGESFEILKWIPEMAKEYGWTSGILDEDMGRAIEKAREDPKDPWGFQESLAKSRFSYEAMRFCQGARAPEEIHSTDSAYEGDEILAIRPL